MSRPLLAATHPASSTLHIPDSFRVTDVGQMIAWLRAYPLVTLVTAGDDGQPRSSVGPLLVRSGPDWLRLYSHLDRQNGQIEHLAAGRRVLVIAQGPQAYVSPAWFERRPAAPTYFHITVHIQARPELLDQAAAVDVLLDTVAAFERDRDGWEFDGGDRYLRGMSKGIAAFELRVEAIEAACKLGQDRRQAERDAIAERLARSDDSRERKIAELLRDSTMLARHS